jgi:hypothetical protein
LVERVLHDGGQLHDQSVELFVLWWMFGAVALGFSLALLYGLFVASREQPLPSIEPAKREFGGARFLGRHAAHDSAKVGPLQGICVSAGTC